MIESNAIEESELADVVEGLGLERLRPHEPDDSAAFASEDRSSPEDARLDRASLSTRARDMLADAEKLELVRAPAPRPGTDLRFGAHRLRSGVTGIYFLR